MANWASQERRCQAFETSSPADTSGSDRRDEHLEAGLLSCIEQFAILLRGPSALVGGGDIVMQQPLAQGNRGALVEQQAHGFRQAPARSARRVRGRLEPVQWSHRETTPRTASRSPRLRGFRIASRPLRGCPETPTLRSDVRDSAQRAGHDDQSIMNGNGTTAQPTPSGRVGAPHLAAARVIPSDRKTSSSPDTLPTRAVALSSRLHLLRTRRPRLSGELDAAADALHRSHHGGGQRRGRGVSRRARRGRWRGRRHRLAPVAAAEPPRLRRPRARRRRRRAACCRWSCERVTPLLQWAYGDGAPGLALSRDSPARVPRDDLHPGRRPGRDVPDGDPLVCQRRRRIPRVRAACSTR